MRQQIIIIISILLLNCLTISAQEVLKPDSGKLTAKDTITTGKGNREDQLKEIKSKKNAQLSDSAGLGPGKSKVVDTTKQNKYGDILNDDTSFTPKNHLWVPLTEVLGTDAFVWSIDRFIMKADFSRIGLNTWKYNIQKGWEWDTDRFGINFIGHPYSGTLSFNAGRANGYNYFQSASFAALGSLIWEYFGENTRPSYNDLINTPINGAFLGEIMYRISSNILDDRTRRAQRTRREILAAIIDPMRGFNRLVQGKTARLSNKEVYQNEPLNITLFGGIHQINKSGGINPSQASTNPMVNIQLDYGNPFEDRKRKPFDFFKLRAEFSFGVGRKTLDNVTGYGILTGKNSNSQNQSFLYGVFQYYDYWDNKTFELGAIGFGPGVFWHLIINKTSSVFSNLHVALIPFAGNSTYLGPDTSQVRDYNFGNGLEGKFETTLNVGNSVSASLVYYQYIIKTNVGIPGNNFIGIVKPKIALKIYKNLMLGFEHFIYYNVRDLNNGVTYRSTRTEEKFYLQLFWEDKQRRGHYN